MSFIDLMGNDVWSSADISNHVQDMIRSQFTAEDELKAARLARKADQTELEKAFIESVDAVISAAIEAGRQARMDMTLLNQVLAVESAQSRLALPVAEPEQGEEGLINQAALDRDVVERQAAQAVLNSTTPEVFELVALRNSEPDHEVVA